MHQTNFQFSSVTTSNSVTNTEFIRNFTSVSTKNTALMTTTTKLETERSTKQMSIPTTVQQKHISKYLTITKSKPSSTEDPSSPSALQSTLSKYQTNDIKICFYKHES